MIYQEFYLNIKNYWNQEIFNQNNNFCPNKNHKMRTNFLNNRQVS